MRILITGASGFVGGYLAELLASRPDAELHAVSRTNSSHRPQNITWHITDLNDRPALDRILADVEPSWIFHLAGYAHAGRSHREQAPTYRNNAEATGVLYQAILASGRSPHVLFVSTGLVYGEVAGKCDEATPLNPSSPYAFSKTVADELSRELSKQIDIVIARPFNHVGPRQSPDYVVARFASQIAAIERGEQPPVLDTGDLDARRDFTDVRDVVRAYLALMEHGRIGEAYNVASGVTRRVGDVLDALLALSPRRIEVRSDPNLRPVERAAVQVDVAKLHRDTRWRPEVPFDKTLRDTLEYWRTRKEFDS